MDGRDRLDRGEDAGPADPPGAMVAKDRPGEDPGRAECGYQCQQADSSTRREQVPSPPDADVERDPSGHVIGRSMTHLGGEEVASHVSREFGHLIVRGVAEHVTSAEYRQHGAHRGGHAPAALERDRGI